MFSKNCPKCGNSQTYSRMDVFNLAVKNNTQCLVRQQNLINKIHPTLFLRYDEQWNRLYDAEILMDIQTL